MIAVFRVARFGPVMPGRLPDFDLRYAGLINRLETLTICPDTVIHGDLVPGNILVDAQARPLAVLDRSSDSTAQLASGSISWRLPDWATLPQAKDAPAQARSMRA